LLSQDYPESKFEIIVIDSGSTDATLQSLQPYQDRIRWIHQENHGVSAARNRGVVEARFDWIAFLDSDDLWLPAKLLRQKSALQSHPHHLICYTDEVWRKMEGG
jgi:glycosyltransferase involved in cell wall biosynthesis